MSSTRSRVLAVTMIATSFVASIAWTLVLLGAGGSHAASFRLVRGVSVVLHHDDEDVRALGHVHRHHGHEHRHATADPHADDHLVSVSAEPASLRSQDGFVGAGDDWAGPVTPLVQAVPSADMVVRVRPSSRIGRAGPLERSTIVLLL